MEEIHELKERLERERPVEWEAFPDIGLYMDQLISYMPRQLIHYGEGGEPYLRHGQQLHQGRGHAPGRGKAVLPHPPGLSDRPLCALKQVLSVKDAAGCWPPRRRGGRPRSPVRTVFGGAGPGAGRDGGRPGRQRRGGRSCPAWPWPLALRAMPTGWPVSGFWNCCRERRPPAGEEPKITGRARYV